MGFQELSLYGDSLHGLKVVDTSFFGRDLYFFHASVSRTLMLLEHAYEFCREFEQFIDSSFTFPAETVSEFGRGVVGLRRFAKSIRRSLREKDFHRMRREELTFVVQKLFNLAELRKRVVKKVLRPRSTEEHLQGSSWESYLPAILDITRREGIKIDYAERHGNFPASERYREYDERIFAKSIGLSRNGAVYLLTGDSDFCRMYKTFYHDLDDLAMRYGFCVPEYPLFLITYFPRSGLEIVKPFEGKQSFSGGIERLPVYEDV